MFKVQIDTGAGTFQLPEAFKSRDAAVAAVSTLALSLWFRVAFILPLAN